MLAFLLVLLRQRHLHGHDHNEGGWLCAQDILQGVKHRLELLIAYQHPHLLHAVFSYNAKPKILYFHFVCYRQDSA